jgi:hypothetical protein
MKLLLSPASSFSVNITGVLKENMFSQLSHSIRKYKLTDSSWQGLQVLAPFKYEDGCLLGSFPL